jgi:hypothetical protein
MNPHRADLFQGDRVDLPHDSMRDCLLHLSHSRVAWRSRIWIASGQRERVPARRCHQRHGMDFPGKSGDLRRLRSAEQKTEAGHRINAVFNLDGVRQATSVIHDMRYGDREICAARPPIPFDHFASFLIPLDKVPFPSSTRLMALARTFPNAATAIKGMEAVPVVLVLVIVPRSPRIERTRTRNENDDRAAKIVAACDETIESSHTPLASDATPCPIFRPAFVAVRDVRAKFKTAWRFCISPRELQMAAYTPPECCRTPAKYRRECEKCGLAA